MNIIKKFESITDGIYKFALELWEFTEVDDPTTQRLRKAVKDLQLRNGIKIESGKSPYKVLVSIDDTDLGEFKKELDKLVKATQWQPIADAPTDRPVLWLLPNADYGGSDEEDDRKFFIPTMLCWNKHSNTWWSFTSEGEPEDEFKTEDLTGYFLDVPLFPEHEPTHRVEGVEGV